MTLLIIMASIVHKAHLYLTVLLVNVIVPKKKMISWIFVLDIWNHEIFTLTISTDTQITYRYSFGFWNPQSRKLTPLLIWLFFPPCQEFSKVLEHFMWTDVQPLSLCDPPLNIGKPSQNGHQISQAQHLRAASRSEDYTNSPHRGWIYSENLGEKPGNLTIELIL